MGIIVYLQLCVYEGQKYDGIKFVCLPAFARIHKSATA